MAKYFNGLILRIILNNQMILQNNHEQKLRFLRQEMLKIFKNSLARESPNKSNKVDNNGKLVLLWLFLGHAHRIAHHSRKQNLTTILHIAWSIFYVVIPSTIRMSLNSIKNYLLWNNLVNLENGWFQKIRQLMPVTSNIWIIYSDVKYLLENHTFD